MLYFIRLEIKNKHICSHFIFYIKNVTLPRATTESWLAFGQACVYLVMKRVLRLATVACAAWA